MTLISKDELLKPQPLKTSTVDLGDGKQAKLKELPFAEIAKMTAWLFPEGEEDKQRRESYRLRQAALSLVDEAGDRVFAFPDTKEGNKQFFEFAETVGSGGAGHWGKIISATVELYDESEEADDLEKK